MAEYRLEFIADGSRAGRTIDLLEKAIRQLTREFKNAEIGSGDFLEAASRISNLTKEVNEAKSAVVSIERAQRQFNQALDAGNRAFGNALQAAQRYNDGLQKIANEGYQEQAKLRDKNYQDELDDWDRRLNAAVTASSKIASQQRAIMEFRAGMGARGAIPAVASPIRGGVNYPGSPEFFEAIDREARRAANTAGKIQPPAQAFSPGSLAAFEQKLQRLKNEARLISPDTSRWRELNKQIIETERSVQKLRAQQTGGPSTRARLGAAGGAFLYGGGLGGGVGSALGGVAGGLLGGVSGAFTGAAFGQLADNLARYAAGIASTVADVNKARIALAGVTRNAQDYDKALEAVTAGSQKFLLPIVDATQQFTKLQASIVGAGYDTTVTTKAFNAIGAAVIATGGNTEDLNGALRATSQVFSKGKVSAEELRQQIGERLPGAFTIFAQSIEKTPQQLDKLLEEGKVTLDDFIKFLGELDKRYGTTAELLAKAPENAGARLQVALQAASVAFGGFFQKVGAGFQGYLTDLVNFVLQNQEQVKKLIATFAVAAQDIYRVFSVLINNLAPLFTNFFKFIFTNFAKGVNALADFAERARAGSGSPGKRAAAAVDLLYEGRPLAGHLGERRKAYEEALSVEMQYDKGLDGRRRSREARVGEMVNQMFTPFRPTRFGAGIGAGAAVTGGGAAGATGARGGRERESRLPELTEQLNLAKQLLVIEQQISTAELGGNQLAVIRLNGIKEQLRIQSEIAKVNLQQNIPLVERQRQIQILTTDAEKERLQTNFKIQQQIQSEIQRVQDAMVGIATSAKQELEDRQEYEKLVKDGLAPALAQITVEVRRQFATEVEKLKTLEKQVQAEIGVLESKQAQTDNDKKQLKILRERLALIQGGIADAPALAGEAVESRRQRQLLEDQPRDASAYLREASDAAQRELAKLTNWGFQAVEGAKAIGSAFGQAFKDIISGSASAQEALANMMQSIADHFLDMAAQIIAQQITMMIYGMILKALGVMGGASNVFGAGGAPNYSGAFGSAPGTSFSGAMNMPLLAANGAVWQGGFTPFANGGVVNGPTLGLVGEGRYNEAIVPLPDGRSIPVQLQGDSLRDRMDNGAGNTSSTPMLSMNFQSTTINGVEYVDRAQLEAAMAETRRIAVREGASRGATIALDRLANSPNSRRRVGLR